MSLQETCLSGQELRKNLNIFRKTRHFGAFSGWRSACSEKVIFIVYNFYEKCLNRSSFTILQGRKAPKECDPFF